MAREWFDIRSAERSELGESTLARLAPLLLIGIILPIVYYVYIPGDVQYTNRKPVAFSLIINWPIIINL